MRMLTLLVCFVSYNGLGPAAGEVLGDSIQSNRTMRHLILKNNCFNSTACFSICVGVVENLAMQRIVLDDNPIGEAGANAVMQVGEGND